MVILLNYSNSLFSPFQFDDELIIQNNPYIKNSTYLQSAKVHYRHIFYLTFALNYYWGKLNPFGYHLFNVLLHFSTSIIVFFIAFITIEKGILWNRKAALKIASITSLFFALNPAHSETVTYISGRGSGLAGFFYLLSLLLFILGSLKYKGIRFLGQVLYFLSIIAGAMAVFSKEISVTLPAAIVLYDICFIKKGNWIRFRDRFLFYYFPFPILAIFFLKKSSTFLYEVSSWLKKIDFGYAFNQLKIISYVIKLYIFPINMTFNYDFSRANFFGDATNTVVIGFLLTIMYLVFKKFYQKSAILSFSALWYFVTISPTNTFLPRMDLFSDRNLYLPSFGLSLFFAVVVYLFFASVEGKNSKTLLSIREICTGAPKVPLTNTCSAEGNKYNKKYSTRMFICFGFLVVILSANSAILIKRNASYKSNISFWEESYEKSPNQMRVLHNLSHYYLLNNDIKKAFVMLKRLVVFNPANYYAHVNLGKLYLDSGNNEMAEREFKRAIEVDPKLPEAYFNLGSFYASKGLFLKAKGKYEKADLRYGWNLQKLPELFRDEMRAKLILNKAKINLDLGLFLESEKELNRYIKKYPDSGQANYLLAQVYTKIGKDELALKILRKHKGDRFIQAKIYNDIGLIYLRQNKFEEAIGEFEKAVSNDPGLTEAQYNLGKILLEIRNDRKKARFHLEKALALKPGHEKAEIIKKTLLQFNN